MLLKSLVNFHTSIDSSSLFRFRSNYHQDNTMGDTSIIVKELKRRTLVFDDIYDLGDALTDNSATG